MEEGIVTAGGTKADSRAAAAEEVLETGMKREAEAALETGMKGEAEAALETGTKREAEADLETGMKGEAEAALEAGMKRKAEAALGTVMEKEAMRALETGMEGKAASVWRSVTGERTKADSVIVTGRDRDDGRVKKDLSSDRIYATMGSVLSLAELFRRECVCIGSSTGQEKDI